MLASWTGAGAQNRHIINESGIHPNESTSDNDNAIVHNYLSHSNYQVTTDPPSPSQNLDILKQGVTLNLVFLFLTDCPLRDCPHGADVGGKITKKNRRKLLSYFQSGDLIWECVRT